MTPGQIVEERFVIDHRVGAGGMGDVYKARDLTLGQLAALKVLRSSDEQSYARFEREVRTLLTLSQLSHPGIVRYLHHGRTADGHPYLAMEWLVGEDLAVHMHRQPLSPVEALLIGRGVVGALAAAHEKGVVHRDIKPANIFLVDGDPQRVRLLDFGIARMSGAVALTATGAVLGTPAYMAPEQVRGERELSATVDLYSLGCVLFETLSGGPPFPEGEHPMSVFAKILLDTPPPLASLRPELPLALTELVDRLLNKDPAQRPQTAKAVLESLERIDLRSLGALRVGPSLVRKPALTTVESRILTLVLARPRGSVTEEGVAAAVPGSAAVGPSGGNARTWVAEEVEQRAAVLRKVAAPFKGRCELLPDGALVVLFSGQQAATDQVALAARCALALHGLSEVVGVAVCTGRRVADTGTPFGEILDRAAALLGVQLPKLQSRVGLGLSPVLLDAMSSGLLDSRFHRELRDGVQLLHGENLIGEPRRLFSGRPTPFVGRDRETAILDAAVADLCADPSARAVLILGDAGLGKTRIVQEFLQRLETAGRSALILLGRGDPITQSAPFGLLRKALQQAAGAPLGDGDPALGPRLLSLVADYLPPARQRRVAAFLCELCGVPSPEPVHPELLSARVDAMLMGDQIRRAVEEFLAAACERRPVILILEDLHLGDLSSVKIIDSALRNLAEQPLLVVGLARPHLYDVLPNLFSGRAVQEVRLGPLSRRSAEKLAREVLGLHARPFSDEKLAAIVQHAGGNVLFLEELLRAAVEQAHESKDVVFPESLVAIVQSRIERLEPTARLVLRAASVFGHGFSRGGVLQLLGGADEFKDLAAWLELLCDRELLSRGREVPGARAEHTTTGDDDVDEFVFRHTLVREAAYAMFTDPDRKLAHRLAAEYLEERKKAAAAVLAEHYERGGVRMAAGRNYLRAAREALEGNDFLATIQYAERALSCEPVPFDVGECRLVQADAYQWRGDYAEAARLGHIALEALPVESESWLRAVGTLAISAGRRIDVPEIDGMIALLRPLLSSKPAGSVIGDGLLVATVRVGIQAYIIGRYEATEALFESLQTLAGDASMRPANVQGMQYLLQANRAQAGWRLDEAAQFFEQSGAAFERAGDLRNAISQQVDAGFSFCDIGCFERALSLFETTLAQAQRMNIPRLSTVSWLGKALALYYLNRIPEALEVALRAQEQLDALADVRMRGSIRIIVARCLFEQGQFEACLHKVQEAVSILANMARFRARGFSLLSRAELLCGHTAAALAAAEQGMALIDELGRIGTDEAQVRLAYVSVLQVLGRQTEAHAELQVAALRLREQADCIVDPVLRRQFLIRMPGHKEIVEQAPAHFADL